MKKFDVKKLTGEEIRQLELLRKFDDYFVESVHNFNDNYVSIQFKENFILNVKLSPFVLNWLLYVWLKMINRKNYNVLVFNHTI